MLIAFHKPYGVLSQFNQNPDRPDQPTLQGFGLPKEVHPVGRLDMDSEGLLLLSDDPTFERELLHPTRSHHRTYTVQVDGTPDTTAIEQLRRGGLLIRGHSTKPCQATLLASDPPLAPRDPAVVITPGRSFSWLKLTLTEGKNRQVRRMTAAIGHPTLRLVRTKIGELSLAPLAPGEWMELNPNEERAVFL
ncbi:pseudouridine synthase [Sulfuriroseicoccus oceanibius]|uniref:Pseudouridine synthase n=1 Tax=Sulfuriroseicoccus oceanibius TaxID=2707525 RepID=A0A6B3LCK2_9BACT|nr:pseudouridine synthase [Sulfuriroseicoccus oceanibius]QQL45159.1 pseudouridine synthase [Sulfuriroseicoccus oceanibius]